MKPLWIYEKDCFSEYLDKVQCTLENLGHDLMIVDGPKSLDGIGIDASRPVIIKGSFQLAAFRQPTEFIPGFEYGWDYNFDNYKISNYHTKWLNEIDLLFNRNGMFLPMDLLIHFFDNMADRDEKGRLFVKSDSGKKILPGGLYTKEQLIQERDFLVGRGVDPATMLYISSPLDPEALTEVRVVVAEGKVISASQYMTDGKVIPKGEHIEYKIQDREVNSLLPIITHSWQPAPIYIVDLLTGYGKPQVIEINCFNTSSLYGCDLEKVFDVAGDIAIREFNERS